MFLRPDWACARARRWCYTDVLSCWPAGTLNVPPASAHDVANPTARLMLVAVSLAWGLSWPAMKIALNEIPPFSMRVGTSGLATIALFALALMQGRTVSVKSSVARAHLMVAGCLNIACFTLFAAFAQLATATSRVAILTYTMPIWAALLAYPVLGERFNLSRGISLLLAIVGLAVLIYPLIGSSDVLGLMLALATATSWAAGTVYLKWAQIDADPMAISAWQLCVGLLVTVAGMLIFEGSLHLWPVHPRALWALFFSAVVGSAFAYLLWFEIVRRLPATTASLGVLSVPVVGILSSVLILGERPTVTDIVGSAFILAAAAGVLLAPNARSSQTAPIEQ
ncbi:MAG: EamA/RhaT family transporter [Alphaproteobacteria bacterium]|nr:MAG: EamA/RhaT family transporter [Alphaproteobacteria bacterium]